MSIRERLFWESRWETLHITPEVMENYNKEMGRVSAQLKIKFARSFEKSRKRILRKV